MDSPNQLSTQPELAESQAPSTIKKLQEAKADLENLLKAYPAGQRTPDEERDMQLIAQEVAGMEQLLNRARTEAGLPPVQQALDTSRAPNAVHVDEHYLVTNPEEHREMVSRGEITPSSGGRE